MNERKISHGKYEEKNNIDYSNNNNLVWVTDYTYVHTHEKRIGGV